MLPVGTCGFAARMQDPTPIAAHRWKRASALV